MTLIEWLKVAAIVAILAYVGFNMGGAIAECHKYGGTLVRGPLKLECLKGVK